MNKRNWYPGLRIDYFMRDGRRGATQNLSCPVEREDDEWEAEVMEYFAGDPPTTNGERPAYGFVSGTMRMPKMFLIP